MKKKNNPMGCAFWIVIAVTFIVAEIIGINKGMSPVDKGQFRGYCIAFAALIYGLIYYIIKKFRE